MFIDFPSWVYLPDHWVGIEATATWLFLLLREAAGQGHSDPSGSKPCMSDAGVQETDAWAPAVFIPHRRREAGYDAALPLYEWLSDVHWFTRYIDEVLTPLNLHFACFCVSICTSTVWWQITVIEDRRKKKKSKLKAKNLIL